MTIDQLLSGKQKPLHQYFDMNNERLVDQLLLECLVCAEVILVVSLSDEKLSKTNW